MVDYFLRENTNFSDEYKIHTVLSISKALHDKVDSLSDIKDAKAISNKICKIIHKIDFG